MREALQPRQAVQKMMAYSPPAPGRARKVRLDLNENTTGCSPNVAKVLCSRISASSLAIYPDYVEANVCLAEHFGVSVDEMLFTNGTDEAIQLLMSTFVETAAKVIILSPSYSMYRFYAELVGAEIEAIAYHEGTLAFPLEELLAAIGPATKAILIANPNNPTGTAAKLDAIKHILQRAPHAAILIDEAYFEFCGITALPLIQEFPNLFVSRTFSKAYGMAGIRFGCLFSDARNLVFARKVRPPYSVNSLGTLAAMAAVNDSEYTTRYVDEVLAAREFLYAELDRLGVPFYRSEGNFVLMSLGNRSSEICAQLHSTGVLVRDRGHELAGCVRVTVGTRGEVARFIEELTRLR
jgi:histidinol-phosphate aminotransferase